MHSLKNKASVSQHISLTNSDVYSNPPFYLRGDGSGRNGSHVADFEEIQHSTGNGCHHAHDTDHHLSSTIVSSSILNFGGLTNILGSTETESSGPAGDTVYFENWGSDSDVVAHHSNKFTHTDFPGIFLNQRFIQVDSMSKNIGHQKPHCRRLAQNREAAKKSRMRKKAYVQELENNMQRLTQLEHDLERTRQQGIDHNYYERRYSIGSTEFDIDYERWLDKHQRLINDLRSAVNLNLGENELSHLLEQVMSHYDGIFRLKGSFAKSNIFHILSGMWKTPAERFLMWLGGFRSSDFLQVTGNQIEALTEEQLMKICHLQQSSQEAEYALSQGMETLQQSILDTISSNSISDNYVGQMAIAMSELTTLENFLCQADLLRLQTLQQLQRILTPRQMARALLAINDYNSILRALSSLWLARPHE